jgi:hypothetical protein
VADTLNVDGFTSEPDGTVTIRLDDGVRRLRRPKVGELRRLKDRYRDELDAIQSVAEHVRSEGAHIAIERAGLPIAESDEGSRMRLDELKHEERNLLRALNEAKEGAALSWLRFAFEGGEHYGEHVNGLADKPLPVDDDLPSWFLSLEAGRSLLDHWQTAPPLHGAR